MTNYNPDEGGPLSFEDAISHAYDKGAASDRCGLEHRQLYAWLLELRLCRSDLRRLLTALDESRRLIRLHVDGFNVDDQMRDFLGDDDETG